MVIVIEEVDVFGVPFATIVAGVNIQAASEGKPEQVRVIVPVNPVELDTLIDDVPEPPGAEIVTVDCVDAITP